MVDWRLQNQERYLKGVALHYAAYKPASQNWEHDHCEFCGRKFSLLPQDLNAGYCTSDEYHWICVDCYADFKEMFGWTVTT